MTTNDTPSLPSQRAALNSEVGRCAKTASEIEGDWFVALDLNAKCLFLARLMHALTVVGRDSYTVQSDGLDNPEHLRRINEIQHRVSACLRNILLGDAEVSFQRAMATWLLDEPRLQLRHQLDWAWRQARTRSS